LLDRIDLLINYFLTKAKKLTAEQICLSGWLGRKPPPKEKHNEKEIIENAGLVRIGTCQ
jgi:hypothetical protein